MSPIELLRELFQFEDVIDDYQLVILVFEESVSDRVELDCAKDMIKTLKKAAGLCERPN